MRRRLRQYLPGPESIADNRWLRPFAGRLLHPRLWQLNRHSVAGGLAIGLFCGLIPGPLQMLGAALCAVLWRVNLPLAMATTLYTNPFTIVPIYLLAYRIGRAALGDASAFVAPPLPGDMGLSAWTQALVAWGLSVSTPLACGLVILGGMLALAGYGLVQAGWRLALIWRRRRRGRR